jgi:hypothetical protein
MMTWRWSSLSVMEYPGMFMVYLWTNMKSIRITGSRLRFQSATVWSIGMSHMVGSYLTFICSESANNFYTWLYIYACRHFSLEPNLSFCEVKGHIFSWSFSVVIFPTQLCPSRNWPITIWVLLSTRVFPFLYLSTYKLKDADATKGSRNHHLHHHHQPQQQQ